MMTRKDYHTEMRKHPLDSSERKKIHQKYFAQFVTEKTFFFVHGEIGVEKLLKSKCEYFNDVVKMQDWGWTWDLSPINTVLAKELGENSSQATRTCVGKAAARIILEDLDNE